MSAKGSAHDVVQEYMNTGILNASDYDIEVTNQNDLPGYAYRISIEDLNNRPSADIKVGQPWQIRVYVKIKQDIQDLVIGIGMLTTSDLTLRTSWTRAFEAKPGEYEIVFSEDNIILEPGKYPIVIGLSQHGQTFQYAADAGYINIIEMTTFEEQSRYQRIGKCGFLLNPMKVYVNYINKCSK